MVKGYKQYKLLTKGSSYTIPSNWTKISVEFEQCEVVSREFYKTEEIDESPSIRELLDSMGKEKKAVKSSISMVIYKHRFADGVEKNYRSEPIKADEISTRIRIRGLGKGQLFVDPFNRDNYFFKIF